MSTRTAKRASTRRAPQRSVEDVEPAPATTLPPLVAAAIVFIAAGAVLVLEILAVRLLAPYVGLTLETTTSIIGAALAGIALGAAIGGRMADRMNTRKLVVGLLLGGGTLALLTVPLVRWLGPGARGDGELAALGITLVALVPPAAVLSAVSPAVAHLQLRDLSASGTVVGKLSAWATAGALLGTFGTGFMLVPLMPVSSAVLLTGVLLLAVGLAFGIGTRQVPTVVAAIIALLAVGLGVLSTVLDSPCDAETTYHCASIVKDGSRADGRNLRLDDLSHSYVALRDPAHLELPYVRWIAGAIDSARRPEAPVDAVFIGGGGFTLPRWLLATRPGSTARVLEVDGALVDFDREQLGLRTSRSLQVDIGDARIGMLDVASDSADVVVGDAFGAVAVPWHLSTTEWSDEVRRVLKPGGIYALNVIDFQPSDLLRAEAATLLQRFADVRLVTYTRAGNVPSGGNAVLIASDRPLPLGIGSAAAGAGADMLKRSQVEAFAGDAEVLTDDDAPVDQLLTTRDL